MWEPPTVPNKSMSRADHPSTGNNFIQALKEIKMLQSLLPLDDFIKWQNSNAKHFGQFCRFPVSLLSVVIVATRDKVWKMPSTSLSWVEKVFFNFSHSRCESGFVYTCALLAKDMAKKNVLTADATAWTNGHWTDRASSNNSIDDRLFFASSVFFPDFYIFFLNVTGKSILSA